MRKIIFLTIVSLLSLSVYAQHEQKFSAVNPVLFNYKTSQVYINPPVKFNGGKNIISPDPDRYPWEAKLENGMPNVVRDINGFLAIYLSCFLVHSDVPFSKVGSFAFTNNTNSLTGWTRPDAGLYWYNPAGKTVDEKISPTYQTGFRATNIVAVDIESMGIYEDTDPGVMNPFKVVYLPQRENLNHLVAAYEMPRTFEPNGILSGFTQMKEDRQQVQKEFTFRFINADTHMNLLKQNGKYYLMSRINAKRSSLLPGETLPFPGVDPRVRYRRETITELGENLESKACDIDVALDMSDNQWEPYSVQPFRLPGFDTDVWWGLVTAFGTRADESVANRQRTELAISNDGLHWRYLKPGSPFLDNGTDPQSDDHGCINVAKPILAEKFSSNPRDLLYFYAASRQLHVSERNSGISLAIGKYGKWAGLRADEEVQKFHSINPVDTEFVTEATLPKVSLYDLMRLGSSNAPYVLADVTEDPRGKKIADLNSYVLLRMSVYDPDEEHGEGMLLGGSLGSSKQGTTNVSDNYEYVGMKDDEDLHSKGLIFKYMKSLSESRPDEIIALRHLTEVPVVLTAEVKNATFYGLKFNVGYGASVNLLDITVGNRFVGRGSWGYKPIDPAQACHTFDFSDIEHVPNQFIPTQAEKGTIAVSLMAKSTSQGKQSILRMYGDDKNYIGLSYTSEGVFQYRTVLHGTEFASMTIAPPVGQTFNNHKVVLTVEALKNSERKYGKDLNEDATVLRVSCPDLNFEQVVQQPILWNWKHAEGSVTDTDKANARAFAYVNFSAFVAGIDKITVGGIDAQCTEGFNGEIYNVEISKTLPPGTNDFWE